MKQALVRGTSRYALIPDSLVTVGRSFLIGVVFGIIVLGGACEDSSSTDGGGLQNVSQSAPFLDDFDESGNYVPYKATSNLNRPRYLHKGLLTLNGLTFIFGGSDERALSTLDTVEFYDQAARAAQGMTPESETGVWFDTNFEGDPMAFEGGPRIFHTVNALADGRIIVIGGTPDIEASQRLYAKAEIFDPETRTFEQLEESMIVPRFQHTTTRLFNGNFLVIGGEEVSTITVINMNIEPGQTGRQEQRSVFQSTVSLEEFVLAENAFTPFTLPESDRESVLSTPRGRSRHTVGQLAGFDRRLDTADDIYIIAGGIQTLSGQAAPQTKQYGSVGRQQADGLTSIEFLDPVTRIVTQAANVALFQARIDTPHLMNLGQFNDETIDGVLGMGNLLLSMGGNADDVCPETIFNRDSEVFVGNFTGIGPAQGLQFFEVQPDTGQHIEGFDFASNRFPLPLIDFAGRSQTNPVALPRSMFNTAGEASTQTWVASLGGTHIIGTLGCGYVFDGIISTGAMFDPFYNFEATLENQSPRDLTRNRTDDNPTGVVGSWLTIDSLIPTISDDGYQTESDTEWGEMKTAWRVYALNLAVPGADGIIGTPDDRVLLSGGGSDGRFVGGEPASPSAELLLPPGSTSSQPSD